MTVQNRKPTDKPDEQARKVSKLPRRIKILVFQTAQASYLDRDGRPRLKFQPGRFACSTRARRLVQPTRRTAAAAVKRVTCTFSSKPTDGTRRSPFNWNRKRPVMTVAPWANSSIKSKPSAV